MTDHEPLSNPTHDEFLPRELWDIVEVPEAETTEIAPAPRFGSLEIIDLPELPTPPVPGIAQELQGAEKRLYFRSLVLLVTGAVVAGVGIVSEINIVFTMGVTLLGTCIGLLASCNTMQSLLHSRQST